MPAGRVAIRAVDAPGSAGWVELLVPQPERRLGWLQLAAQGGQVDLHAEPVAEGGDRAGGVIAAAVEAAVDEGLNPAAQRLEHRRHRQGRGGHDQAGALGQQPSSPRTTPA
jgi:hypothetical protein